jgi:hypothetical protein
MMNHMSEEKCPFKVGDTVIYKPTWDGRGKIIMTDLSALEPGRKYKIVRVVKDSYVVPEGFEKTPLPDKWSTGTSQRG